MPTNPKVLAYGDCLRWQYDCEDCGTKWISAASIDSFLGIRYWYVGEEGNEWLGLELLKALQEVLIQFPNLECISHPHRIRNAN